MGRAQNEDPFCRGQIERLVGPGGAGPRVGVAGVSGGIVFQSAKTVTT